MEKFILISSLSNVILLIIFIVILLEIKKQLNKGSNFINNIFGN